MISRVPKARVMFPPNPTAMDADVDVPSANGNHNNNDDEDGHHSPPPAQKSTALRRTRRVVPARTAVISNSHPDGFKPKMVYGEVVAVIQKQAADRPLRKRGQSRRELPNGVHASSQTMPPPPPAPKIRLCPSTGFLHHEYDYSHPISSPSPPPMSDADVKLWIVSNSHEPAADPLKELGDGKAVVPPGTSEPEKNEEPPRPANIKLRRDACYVRLEKLEALSPNSSIRPKPQEFQREKETEQRQKKRGTSHHTFGFCSESEDEDEKDFVQTPSRRKASRFSPIKGHHISSGLNLNGFLDEFRVDKFLSLQGGKDVKKVEGSFYVQKKPKVRGTERVTRSVSNYNNGTRAKSSARAILSGLLTDDESGEEGKRAREQDDEDLKKAILLSKRDAEKKLKMEQDAAKLPSPPSAIPLTDDMIQEVIRNFALPSATKIVTKFTLTIRQGHLALFKEREWLEDPNIDFYLEMIRDRNEKMRLLGFNYPKICVFHSFFFKFCSKNEFEVVSEFTNDNIFDCDLALFPILIRDHWRLIVADFNRKTLFCYDSLFRVNDQNLQIIQRYLEREYKLKMEMCQIKLENAIEMEQSLSIPLEVPHNSATMSPESEPEQPEIQVENGITTISFVNHISEVENLPFELPVPSYSVENSDMGLDEDELEETRTIVISPTPAEIPPWEIYFGNWRKDTLDPIQTPLPQQKNGSDCGIFLCQYAESLARGVEPPFDFGQVNMLYFRYLMAYETIRGELVDRTPPSPPILPGSLSPPPT